MGACHRVEEGSLAWREQEERREGLLLTPNASPHWVCRKMPRRSLYEW